MKTFFGFFSLASLFFLVITPSTLEAGYKNRFRTLLGLSKKHKAKFHRNIVYPTPISFKQNGNFKVEIQVVKPKTMHKLKAALPFPTSFSGDAVGDLKEPSLKTSWSMGGDANNIIVSKDKGDPAKNLEEASSTAGYLVIQQKTLKLQLGIGTGWAFSGWAGAGVSLGLDLSGAVKTVSKRNVRTRSEAERLKLFRFIPVNNDGFRKWAEGDELHFATTGAIGFSAGAGTVFLKVGKNYRTFGTFGISVKKLKDGLVSLDVSSIKIKEVSTTAGSILSGANLVKVNKKGIQFSFTFDLKNKDALNAYKKMIAGNILYAQALVLKKKVGIKTTDKVQLTKKAKAKTKGNVFRGAFRVPFLFTWGFNVGKSFTKSEVDMYDPNIIVESHIGLWNKGYVTEGILSRHIKRTTAFSGNFQKITEVRLDDDRHVDLFTGSFAVHYQNDKISGDKLQKELRRLRRKYGFEKTFKMKSDVKNLGFGLIKFSGVISNVATFELMKESTEKSASQFQAMALKRLEHFFKNHANPNSVCKLMHIRGCKKHKISQTKQAMLDVHRKLQDMIEAYNKYDTKRFVKKYATMGSNMMVNRFTFNTCLELMNLHGVTADPYKMTFLLKGTNIKTVKVELDDPSPLIKKGETVD